ncbi:hypothetical protein ACHWQZ_G003388 [Mnemiopsis leidyi]
MDFGLRLTESPTHNTLKINTSNKETVYASSVILSLNSPVIDHMTTTLHMTSLDMLEFSKAAVEVFVDAAYSGTADGINREVFRDVNKMAAVFEVKWFAEKCSIYFGQLVDSSKEPSYEELLLYYEEACFVFQNLKLRHYVVLIDEKLKSLKYKQQFIKNYLENLDNLSNGKLDTVIALAGNEVNYIVQVLVNRLLQLFIDQGPILPGPFRYLLENSRLHLCKRYDKELFDQLFDVLGSLPDEYMRWTFNLYRNTCENKVPNLAAIDKSSNNLCRVTNLLPCHDLDLTKTLDELVDWLSVAEKCTSLLMAVEAVATWRQFHIRTISIETFNSDVLCNLYDRLKEIVKQRGWLFLSPQLLNHKFWSGYWTDRGYNNFNFFHLSPLFSTSDDEEKGYPYIIIDCVNQCNTLLSDLSKETKLAFHFKHPATPTCNQLSRCGFILKTVPSKNALWRVKLCTEKEDYNNEMMHLHDDVRVDNIHLCLTVNDQYCNSDHSIFVPLSWLGWISSDKQFNQWIEQYHLENFTSRKYIVLYDTTA